MIKLLTGADQAADRCWSTAWQVLIKRLTGDDQGADRCWSTGSQVLIKQLIGADKAADRCWSSDWQVLIQRLTGADNVAAFGLIAAAASLQPCPTLCDDIDGSPPGSPVPGILQARTLEWVAISFSNAWKWKVKVKSLSGVQLLATPWTAAYQAPPSMGFSRQEYWSGVPLPSLLALLSIPK